MMGFTATAMRDPIFYNYHRAVDNIAEEYRQTLQLYTKQELEWSDVVLSRVSVTGNSSKVLNSLETFWQKRKVLLSSGVDFQAPNPVMVSYFFPQKYFMRCVPRFKIMCFLDSCYCDLYCCFEGSLHRVES